MGTNYTLLSTFAAWNHADPTGGAWRSRESTAESRAGEGQK